MKPPTGAILFLALMGLFGLVTLPFQFTFLADDWDLLVRSHKGELDWKTLGSYVSRVPISISLVKWQFESLLWERSWILMYLWYACFASGLVLLARRLLENVGLGGPLKLTSPLGLSILIVALYPNNFETFYWPVSMPYSIGVLFLGVGFVWPRISIFSWTAAFLTLETFVLPALALALLPGFLLWQKGYSARSQTVQSLMKWLGACILALALRKYLELHFPPYTYKAVMSFENFAHQSILLFRTATQISFYRTNWISTFLEWLSVASCGLWLLKTKNLRPGYVLGGLAFLFLGGAHALVMKYEAPRAFLGMNILKSLAILTLLGFFLKFQPPRWLRNGVLASLAIAYLSHTLLILSVKNRNALGLARLESELRDQIQKCPEPCTIPKPDFVAYVSKDWILPPFSHDSYLEWVSIRHAPGREIIWQ